LQGYWYAPGWRKYWGAHQKKQARPGLPKSPTAAATGSSDAASTAAPAVNLVATAGGAKPTIFICYATVTGNTQAYINSVAQVLSGCSGLHVVVQDMEEFEGDSWAEAVAAAALIVVATSTYGPGAPPGTAAKFLSWL
jgi:sulfite reductase alpha subunit-like flavoprotein